LSLVEIVRRWYTCCLVIPIDKRLHNAIGT
jgi:hypothetical protein